MKIKANWNNAQKPHRVAKGKLKRDGRQIASEYFAMTHGVNLGKDVTVKHLINEGRKR